MGKFSGRCIFGAGDCNYSVVNFNTVLGGANFTKSFESQIFGRRTFSILN